MEFINTSSNSSEPVMVGSQPMNSNYASIPVMPLEWGISKSIVPEDWKMSSELNEQRMDKYSNSTEDTLKEINVISAEQQNSLYNNEILPVKPKYQPMFKNINTQEQQLRPLDFRQRPTSIYLDVGNRVPLYDETKENGRVDQTKTRQKRFEALLMKPIVSMRGIAYNNDRWWDFDTACDFHSSCNDFLKIVMLTEAQQSAKRIRDIIAGSILEFKFTPQN